MHQLLLDDWCRQQRLDILPGGSETIYLHIDHNQTHPNEESQGKHKQRPLDNEQPINDHPLRVHRASHHEGHETEESTQKENFPVKIDLALALVQDGQYVS